MTVHIIEAIFMGGNPWTGAHSCEFAVGGQGTMDVNMQQVSEVLLYDFPFPRTLDGDYGARNSTRLTRHQFAIRRQGRR